MKFIYKYLSLLLLIIFIGESIPLSAGAWTYYFNDRNYNLEQEYGGQIGTPDNCRLSFNNKECSDNYLAVEDRGAPRVFHQKFFNGKIDDTGLKIGYISAGRQQRQIYIPENEKNLPVLTENNIRYQEFIKLDHINLVESGLRIEEESATGGIKYKIIPDFKGELYGIRIFRKEKTYREQKTWTDWKFGGLAKIADIRIKDQDIADWIASRGTIIADSSNKVLDTYRKQWVNSSCPLFGSCDNWYNFEGHAISADGRIGGKRTEENHPGGFAILGSQELAIVALAVGSYLTFDPLSDIIGPALGLGTFGAAGAAGTATGLSAIGLGAITGATIGGVAGGIQGGGGGKGILDGAIIGGALGGFIGYLKGLAAGSAAGSVPCSESLKDCDVITEEIIKRADPKTIDPIVLGIRQYRAVEYVEKYIEYMKETNRLFNVPLNLHTNLFQKTVFAAAEPSLITLSQEQAYKILDQIASPVISIINGSSNPYGTVDSLSADGWNWTDNVSGQQNVLCGNSIIDPGEQCDLGNLNGTAGLTCSATCQNTTSIITSTITSTITPKSSIQLNAKLNNENWSSGSAKIKISTTEPYIEGCVNFNSNKTECYYNDLPYVIPQTFTDLPLGKYKITGVTEGPVGAKLKTNLPYSQTLTADNSLNFTLDFYNPPTVDLKGNGSNEDQNLYIPNTNLKLDWDSSYTSSCIADGNWSGDKSVSGSQIIENLARGSANPGQGKKYNFSIRCKSAYNPNDVAFDNIKATVWQYPVCSFSASPNSIILPQSSTLSWNCSYANSCSISDDAGNNLGSANNENGSLIVLPTKSTTYKLTCQGLDGQREFYSGNNNNNSGCSGSTVCIDVPTQYQYKEINPQ
ncbi:hypothetical protein HZB04_03570 [Candidatus Wolfebacteria bacterium]|nr:hypothetical protein [Candidatus Wolfebacteria bacterium]